LKISSTNQKDLKSLDQNNNQIILSNIIIKQIKGIEISKNQKTQRLIHQMKNKGLLK
jgi:hypothetical protein